MRGFDRVDDALEGEREGTGIVDAEGRTRIPIARLANRSDIDEIPRVRPQLDDGLLVRCGDESVEDFLLVVENNRQVRVREEAERTAARAERAQRILAVEDVVVFVERRAVTDFDVLIDRFRPGGKLLEVLPVRRRQRLLRPERGQPRDLVEVAAVFDAAGGLVVVAADDGDGVELADAIDDLVRRRAVADEVAEDEQMVPGAAPLRARPSGRRRWRECPR